MQEESELPLSLFEDTCTCGTPTSCLCPVSNIVFSWHDEEGSIFVDPNLFDRMDLFSMQSSDSSNGEFDFDSGDSSPCETINCEPYNSARKPAKRSLLFDSQPTARVTETPSVARHSHREKRSALLHQHTRNKYESLSGMPLKLTRKMAYVDAFETPEMEDRVFTDCLTVTRVAFEELMTITDTQQTFRPNIETFHSLVGTAGFFKQAPSDSLVNVTTRRIGKIIFIEIVIVGTIEEDACESMMSRTRIHIPHWLCDLLISPKKDSQMQVAFGKRRMWPSVQDVVSVQGLSLEDVVDGQQNIHPTLFSPVPTYYVCKPNARFDANREEVVSVQFCLKYA